MKNIQEISIDQLGRTVIPKIMRNALGLHGPGIITIELQGQSAILRPKNCVCSFCGNSNVKLHSFNEHFICDNCLNQLQKVGVIHD